MYKSKRRGKVVFLIVMAGGVLGAILGYVLRDTIPILNQGLRVGTDGLGFDLYLIDLNFSLNVNITLAAIIGFLLAFLLADVGRRS